MTQSGAAITAVTYHLPAARLSNAELVKNHPGWQADRIEEKTGILERRIASAHETAADLAIAAARKLMAIAPVKVNDIDFVIFCTQSPDYLLPTTACLIQHELGLRVSAGAFDMNLGCSGFVYGLGLCSGLIDTGQADRVLLLTADTYTKHLHPDDRSVRAIFGDAGAATLVERVPLTSGVALGPFCYGTNGRGANDLTVPGSGIRGRMTSAEGRPRLAGGVFGPEWLHMNGPNVFNFTLGVVPKLLTDVLSRAEVTMDELDIVIPHQANAFMLEALRKRIKVPSDKFFVHVSDVGNTVSATIPIALVMAASRGLLLPGHRAALLGFGIGLSWAGTLIRWQDTIVGVSDASLGSGYA